MEIISKYEKNFININDNNILEFLKIKKPLNDEIINSENLMNIYYNINDEKLKYKISYYALLLNKNNNNAILQYSFKKIFSNSKIEQYIGYNILERMFNENNIPKLSNQMPQYKILLLLIIKFNSQIHNYSKCNKYLKLVDKSIFNNELTDKIMKATLITGYPESIDDVKEIIKEYHQNIDKLLSCDIINTEMTNDKDKYNFFMLSPFNFELYYETDICLAMKKYYELGIKLFPELNYISPYLVYPKEKNEKYKLGIASSFFYNNNSVIEDFKGVLDRLPRDKFEITFIYFDNQMLESDYLKNTKDNYLIFYIKNENWLNDVRKKIGKLKLDLLLYLDSTMSNMTQRALMSKLAYKQAVSHGHPITSGINNKIVDYYISWEGAELEYEISKNHYTEKLELLPKNVMHQYYKPRIDENGLSVINGKSYKNIDRKYFNIPTEDNWYVCMQKPFKRHPEFDYILSEINKRDNKGRIILHKAEIEENQLIIENRLKKYNVDIKRFHFINSLEHNELMALYSLADINLDSYYAGGCTTTREALELGSIVITLPSTYLGSRWSLAYYNIMGVNDLIVKTKDEYINLCIDITNNIEKKKMLKQKILDNVYKLFYRDEAVISWSNLLERLILE